MKYFLSLVPLVFSIVSFASEGQGTGTIEVFGEAGPSQFFARVKAQRCLRPTVTLTRGRKFLKRVCDEPVYFGLNQKMVLPAGSYIVGYENTLFPGPVEIRPESNFSITLTKIAIPDDFPRDKNIKIYRDFSSLVEQRKIYFEMFYSGKHFFRLTSGYGFGDYYLTDGQRSDNIQWRSYDICNSLESLSAAREQAKFVCQSWNSATSMTQMADLFKFETAPEFEGQFQEAWVSFPGDVIPIRHPRHLVAAPVSAIGFVSVMPGIYKMTEDGRNSKSLRFGTPSLLETYLPEDLTRDDLGGDTATVTSVAPEKNTSTSEFGSRISDRDLEDIEPAIDCGTANIWRTEFRSYCTNDRAEGCDRNIVKKCAPMKIDLRMRKY